VKRSLPSAGKHGRGQSSPAPARERAPLAHPVIAIAQATVGDVGTKLAAALVSALVHEGVTVNVLVTADDPNADTHSAMRELLPSGAARVSIVQVPREHPERVLQDAVDHFPDDALLVVLGNALPALFHPAFCVVVSAARTTHLPQAQRLRILADLELTSPSDTMVTELAKLLAHRYRPRPAADTAR
jgi:hypothetical protein